jgi:hypothetical protein
MTIRHAKDVVLFRMTTAEMRQVMEKRGMVNAAWRSFQTDARAAEKAGRWTPHPFPIKIFHEERGRGHVLQCRAVSWRYFREAAAGNPLEREIRAEMVSLGLSGEADRRISRYAPSAQAPVSRAPRSR